WIARRNAQLARLALVRCAAPILGSVAPPPQRQSLLISSNVLPLVSGTFVMMKTRVTTPKAASVKKVTVEPSRPAMTGKEKLRRKLAPQLAAVATAMAWARFRSG